MKLPKLLSGRIDVRSDALAAVGAFGFALLCNTLFWQAALRGRELAVPGTWLWLGCLFVALWGLHFLMLAPFMGRHTAKPLLAVLVGATAMATYYMQRYTVYLDPSMLRNVLRSDLKEARELFAWSMLPHLLLYAVLPWALLWRVRVKPQPWLRTLWLRPLQCLLALGVAVGALLLVFQDFASWMRNHKEVRYLVTPANYIYSLAVVATEDTRAAARPRQPIGEDAARGALLGPPQQGGQGAAGARKPVLFVIVVGETARAANWGLNGYGRQTTPQLAQWPGLINFSQVRSCGTNTEVSLPCMFSPWGRRLYDEDRIRGSQSLLHVLQRAGFAVQWRDNQSGCKGVCEGLPQINLSEAKVQGLCDGQRCLDEVLLEGLGEQVAQAGARDQLLVLHQLGNHGPAYYLRYPGAFRQFTPTCDSADLRRCSREAVVNAYDNALLYTDHLLERTLAFLRERQTSHDVGLIYISDHGESLGENNLYLHGLPYAIAPREQTEVPFVMWLASGFAQRFRVDTACLAARAAQPVSHDHLFHTVLGLLDVKTAVRDSAMDLSLACRISTP